MNREQPRECPFCGSDELGHYENKKHSCRRCGKVWESEDESKYRSGRGEETLILGDAAEIITEREAQNGPPEQSMKTVVDMWNAYLGPDYPELTYAQGAMLLGIMKDARSRHGDNNLDDYRDGAGYRELAARVRESETESDTGSEK